MQLSGPPTQRHMGNFANQTAAHPGLGPAPATVIILVNHATFQSRRLSGDALTGDCHSEITEHAKGVKIWAREGRLNHCRGLSSDVLFEHFHLRKTSTLFMPSTRPDHKTDLHPKFRRAAKILARDLGVDVTQVAGGGAAGGFAAGMYAFFGAQLQPGIDAVLDAVGFDALAAEADLILTGEGQLDGQSLAGKVPIGIARRTDTPVIAVVGSIGDDAQAAYDHGITAIFAISPGPQTLQAALAAAPQHVAATAENILRTWLAATPPAAGPTC